MHLYPLRDVIVVEEEITETKFSDSGIIVSGYFFDEFDKVKSKMSYGIVKSVGFKSKYLKEGDRVIFRKKSQLMTYGQEDYFIFKNEKDLLAKVNEDGSFTVHPDFILIKISQDEVDGLFCKKIKRNDGTVGDLFIAKPSSDADSMSTYFVRTAEIKSCGTNVGNVEVGDTAILSHTISNDLDIIVGYEGEDRLVVIDAVTSYHEEDNIVDANRRTPHPTNVWREGECNEMSPLFGVIRGDKLIARDPIVFLEHESNMLTKLTGSGIIYEEEQIIYERQVLSVSDRSISEYGIADGNVVLVSDADVFHIKLKDKVISAINDADIMAIKHL